jgi:hypothetical protein
MQRGRAALEGVGFGLISAATVVVAGGLLVDADWGMSIVPYFGVWLLAGAATIVSCAVQALRAGLRRGRPGVGPWLHVAVPPLLALIAPIGVALGGPVRDRWATTALWAAVALLAHLAVAVGGTAGAPRVRAAAAAGLVVAMAGVLGGVVAVERASQLRWRANDFRAVGVPLLIPEIPGLELAGAYAGRYSVSLALVRRSQRPEPNRLVQGTIRPARTAWPPDSCASGADRRYARRNQTGDVTLVFCVQGGKFVLTVWSEDPGLAIEPLLGEITLRPVSGTVLAGFPAAYTIPEPD